MLRTLGLDRSLYEGVLASFGGDIWGGEQIRWAAKARVGLPREALQSSWLNIVWDLDLQDSLKSKMRAAAILILWRASHLLSAA